MEKENNKLKFTLIWSSCLCVLLLMVGLGVSSSIKGTRSVTYGCPSGYVSNSEGSCCKSGYQLADGVCCPSGYSYYSDGGLGAKGCYKVSLWSYTRDTATNVCKPNFSTEEGDEISNCYVNDYHSPVDVVITDNDDSATEDGNCNNTSCEAGKYLYEDEDGCKQCLACPANHYCLSNSSVPKECPSARPYSNIGSDSESDCVTGWCYECNGTGNLRVWASSESDAQSKKSTCGGGWHLRTDLNQSQCAPTSSTTTNVKYTVNFYVNGSIDDTFICPQENIDDTKTCTKKTLHAGETWYADKECTTTIVVTDYVTGDSNYYRCSGNNGEPDTNPDPDTGNNNGGGGTTPSNPTSIPSTSDPTSSSEENVDTNPPTGEIAIFVVWVIAAAAIVYSIWYFKQVREN